MAWMELDDIVLRYELSGESGLPLVLVHEMGGTLESWDFIAPALASVHRVLRMDLRNCGLSEYRPGPLTIDTLSGDIAALLDRLGIRGPVALAGCAVGAAVACHFAASFPGRAAGLIAMAPAVGLPLERRAPAVERAAKLELEGMRTTVDARLANSYPAEMRRNEELYAAIRRRRLAASPWGMADQTRMLASLEMAEELARISCPTLVLAGRFDGDRPPDVVRAVAEQIRGAEYAVLETGHFMPLQTPALVLSRMTTFLASLTSRVQLDAEG